MAGFFNAGAPGGFSQGQNPQQLMQQLMTLIGGMRSPATAAPPPSPTSAPMPTGQYGPPGTGIQAMPLGTYGNVPSTVPLAPPGAPPAATSGLANLNAGRPVPQLGPGPGFSGVPPAPPGTLGTPGGMPGPLTPSVPPPAATSPPPLALNPNRPVPQLGAGPGFSGVPGSGTPPQLPTMGQPGPMTPPQLPTMGMVGPNNGVPPPPTAALAPNQGRPAPTLGMGPQQSPQMNNLLNNPQLLAQLAQLFQQRGLLGGNSGVVPGAGGIGV